MANPLYVGQVDAKHIAASIVALRRLATLVSVDAPEISAPVLEVKIGHYDHGAFLTLELQAFALLWSTGGGRLLGGGIDSPTTFAIVVNKPVEVQIESAIDTLATLVGRQELVGLRRRTGGDVHDLDSAVVEADRRAKEEAADHRRRGPWTEAALAVGQRARSAGFGLDVTYVSPLANDDQIRLRGPVLRHVYNNVPAARASVDRAVAAVTGALGVDANEATAEVTEFVTAELERAQIRQWTAQAFRDALVCGNGYLVLGGDTPARVLPPDDTYAVTDDKFVIRRNGTEEIARGHVLHLRGAHQVGSAIGLSVLEPFVMTTAQADVMRSGISEMSRVDRAEARDWVARTQQMLDRVVADQDQRTVTTLGASTIGLPSPPADLYFSGQETMAPDSGNLHYLERSSDL